MTLEEFRKTIETDRVPSGLIPLLTALWYEAHGDWERAHRIAQDEDGPDAARVHGYLHRREGDDGNAQYWYARAQRPPVGLALDEEWTGLVKEFLDKQPKVSSRS